MFKKGDLVRIREKALTSKDGTNRKWVAEHGYLWLVVWVQGQIVRCKALSTGWDNGSRGALWYADELEKASE